MLHEFTDLELIVQSIVMLFIGFVVCFLILTPSMVNTVRDDCHQAFTNELNSVGIERIEHCHNVHSNWNEIVWISK